jgi:hypothetical protein
VSVRFARSARRRRVSRESIRHVIAHCGLRFEQTPPGGRDVRRVYLGDDAGGHALEVMAIQLADEDLLVIHAMPLRDKYRPQYEEAKRWRR